MFDKKFFRVSSSLSVSANHAKRVLKRHIGLTSFGLFMISAAAACGSKSPGTEASSNEEQGAKTAAPADRPVLRSFITQIKESDSQADELPVGSPSGNGTLEPGCVASIRYLANIARTMDEAIREYGAQNRGAKLDSLVDTQKAVTVVLSAEYLGEFKNQDTISRAGAPVPSSSTNFVKNVNTTVKVGLNITIPTGPDTTSTYITALKSPEGSLFINSFYANASVLNGLRKSCKGLGIETSTPPASGSPQQ